MIKKQKRMPMPLVIVLTAIATILVLALAGLGVYYSNDYFTSRKFEEAPKFVQDNEIGPVTITPELKEIIPFPPQKANITPQCIQELKNHPIWGKIYKDFDWNQESEYSNSIIDDVTGGRCWLKSSGKFQLRVVFKIKNDTKHKNFGLPRDVITFHDADNIYYPTTYTVQPGTTIKPGEAITEDISNFETPYSAQNGSFYIKWGNYEKKLTY